MNTKGLESTIRLNRILMGASIKAGNLTPTQIIACDGLVGTGPPATMPWTMSATITARPGAAARRMTALTPRTGRPVL